MLEAAVKLAGGGALLLAAVIYGRGKIAGLRRSCTELSAFTDLVRYIGDNIEHFMKPIPDIVASFRGEYLRSSGFMASAEEIGLRAAWEGSDFGFPSEAKDILSDFFASIGTGYASDELKLCAYTEKRLSAILEASEAESKNKERIYKTIPPMLAGSVVLILI